MTSNLRLFGLAVSGGALGHLMVDWALEAGVPVIMLALFFVVCIGTGLWFAFSAQSNRGSDS